MSALCSAPSSITTIPLFSTTPAKWTRLCHWTTCSRHWTLYRMSSVWRNCWTLKVCSAPLVWLLTLLSSSSVSLTVAAVFSLAPLFCFVLFSISSPPPLPSPLKLCSDLLFLAFPALPQCALRCVLIESCYVCTLPYSFIPVCVAVVIPVHVQWYITEHSTAAVDVPVSGHSPPLSTLPLPASLCHSVHIPLPLVTLRYPPFLPPFPPSLYPSHPLLTPLPCLLLPQFCY